VGPKEAYLGGTDSHRKLPLGKRVQLPAMSVPVTSVPAPHFRLVSEATASPRASGGPAGRWRFVLQTAEGQTCLAAEDDEPEGSTERLHLLAIVRGLEALDEPSRITLISAGRSISRGIRYGVAQWRESDWQWERYGKLTPVKNGDLWRRIDRAMAIHDVVCQGAAPTIDDLAEPHSSPHVPREETILRSEMPTMRGRKLRFDQPGQASRPSQAAAATTKAPRATGLLDRIVIYLAGLLRPIVQGSRVRQNASLSA
jgi:ribonuclease HI